MKKAVIIKIFIFTFVNLIFAEIYWKTKGYYGKTGYRKVEIEHQILATPNVRVKKRINSNQRLYVNIKGILYCINASDARYLWHFPIGRIKYSERIKEYKGKVFVARKDNYLFSLDAKTGKVIWKKFLNDDFSHAPVLIDNVLIVPGDLRTTFLINPENGNILKRINTYGKGKTPLINRNKIVIFTGFRSISLYSMENGNIDKKWTRKFKDDFVSIPVIGDENVYFGSEDNNVVALDLDSGETKWKFETMAEVNTTFYLSEKYVYAGSNDGNVYCIDKKTGKSIFNFSTGKAITGKIIGKAHSIFFASANGNFYSIDKEKGFLKWKYSYGSNLIHAPFFIKNNIIITSPANGVHAISAFSGGLKWRFKPGNPFTPVFAENDFIYYTNCEGKRLFKFNVKKKKLKWIIKIPERINTRPQIHKNNVFLFGKQKIYIINKHSAQLISSFNISTHCKEPLIYENTIVTSYNNKVIRFNYKTNKIVWQLDIDGSNRPGFSLYNGRLYLGTDKGTVYSVNFKKGNVIFSYNTKGPMKSIPIVSGGNVYFGSADNYFYCLNINNGNLMWKHKTFGDIIASPAFHKKRVYFVSRGHYLFCLNKNNGKMIWNSAMETRLNIPPVVFGRYMIISGTQDRLRFIYTKNGNERGTFFFGNQVNDFVFIHKQRVIFTSKSGIIYILKEKSK